MCKKRIGEFGVKKKRMYLITQVTHLQRPHYGVITKNVFCVSDRVQTNKVSECECE